MAEDRAFEIFCLSSDAAARVKVTISNLDISVFDSGSLMSLMIRSIRTAVFPEPAAAETRRVFPLVSMALLWAEVHAIIYHRSFFGKSILSFGVRIISVVEFA